MKLLGILLGSLLLFSQSALSAEAQVDRMLDELERRLQQKESSFMTGEENQHLRPDTDMVPLELGSAKIQGAIPGMDELQKISSQLLQLSQQVDSLSGELTKLTYEQVQNEEGYVHGQVYYEIGEGVQAQVSSLIVTLNGAEVFAVHPGEASHLTNRRFPIYLGPIAKGTHKLAIELVMRSSGKKLSEYLSAPMRTYQASLDMEVSKASPYHGTIKLEKIVGEKDELTMKLSEDESAQKP